MSKRYPGGIIRKTPQTPSQTSAQGIWDMASVTQAVKENTWPIAGVPDPISKSLRFRASASAYLNRTPTVASNRTTWTWSGWVKRGAAGGPDTFALFFAESGGNTNARIEYLSTGEFRWFYQISGVDTAYTISNALYRDYSAWYHVVYVYDSTQATAANRQILYVNGVQTTNSAVLTPAQNTVTSINDTVTHWLGRNNSPQYFDGYLAEVNFIDGQALTPSSFGNTNDQTGVWQPIAYTGTYGTNGFYLPFSNTASTSTLGNDFSGNSNNWTTNNISLTSGTTYDSMNDVPTQWIPYNTAGDTGALWRGNYCVINPLSIGSSVTIANGNLTFTNSASDHRMIIGSMAVSSGKWYAEFTATSLGNTYPQIGIVDITQWSADSQPGAKSRGWGYLSDGRIFNNNSLIDTGEATYTTGDVIGVAIDLTNNKVYFSKNGTFINSADPAAGTNGYSITSGYDYAFSMSSYDFGTDPVYNLNFGQRPFSYTPPSGFKTLNTTNLPTPTIGATASTTANKYFDINTYTGDGSQTASFTNSGSMQPDMVWSRIRSGTSQAIGVFDSVRGTTGQSLDTAATTAEGTWNGALSSEYGYVSAFNSNGFSVNDGSVATTGGYVNFSGRTYVAWQWRASNATAVTNTAGSITSTVSANTTAGFSIVTYTGNGTSNSTIGHGLGVTPAFVITKNRSNGTDQWAVWHQSLPSITYYLQLNQTAGQANGDDRFGTNNPTSSVMNLGYAGSTNASGSNYVAYCFAQVAGYSAFGSYTGNGSTDGPFIFTGFRPRFVFVKNASSTGSWIEFDSSTNPYNEAGNLINLNTSSTEFTTSDIKFDILSNGFKVRQVNSAVNGSGNTLIYAAFAESPFKYSLAR